MTEGDWRRHRIPLSVPHLGGAELEAMARAVASNWIAPVGPEVDAFEAEFGEVLGGIGALATTSGTAAIHLALRILGVGPGDEVLVSTLTFCASVNPILYQGGRPVFVDSEPRSWNVDPSLVAAELDLRGERGRLPAAVVVVHLFGQPVEMAPILEACGRWGVPVVEDAAEALGTTIEVGGREYPAGTLGTVGAFSFDGSKMITTSMGGMLVSSRPELLNHARKLARQAREEAPHYEHREVGYNYRMSNLLAAFGRAQLPHLPERVAARRRVFQAYREGIGEIPGLELQGSVPWGDHARWLTCVQVDSREAGVGPVELRESLLQRGIESRPVWKPMHLQPVYREMKLEAVRGETAESLFRNGLCLPSSSSLSRGEIREVCEAVREVMNHG